jgi:uncharacterized Zn finger protein
MNQLPTPNKYFYQDTIKDLSESKIFQRGKAYYGDSMVLSLLYDTNDDLYESIVAGSEDNGYEVYISSDNPDDCMCNCPYGDVPCKHIVAVWLNLADIAAGIVPKGKCHKIGVFTSEYPQRQSHHTQALSRPEYQPLSQEEISLIGELIERYARPKLEQIILQGGMTNGDVAEYLRTVFLRENN